MGTKYLPSGDVLSQFDDDVVGVLVEPPRRNNANRYHAVSLLQNFDVHV